jgi:excisionase family DNA binding protein
MNIYTVSALSRALGCSTDLLYDLVRDNLIPHIRLGGAIRFEQDAIKKWLDNGGTAGVHRGGNPSGGTPAPRSGYASGWRHTLQNRRGR